MEATQPLSVGLELVVGLNLQLQSPSMYEITLNAHTTINNTQENLWGSSNGNGIDYVGIPKNAGI